jgi:hypothetical protein
MPSADKKKIEITIKSIKDPSAPIPAMLVAEKFQSLQNLLYVIGDFLEGNPYRTGGDFPNSVKEKFTLVVKDLEIGSVGATLGIVDTQQGLFPKFPLAGEKAIGLASDIVHIAQSDDDIPGKIAEKIPDERRAFRAIQEIDQLWPDARSSYNVIIGLGKPRPYQLNPLRKPVIQLALRKTPEATEKTIVGRLIQIRVDKKHECKIDTPEGEFSCKYTPELEKAMKNFVGNVVSIVGRLKETNRIEITSEKAIEQIPHLPLNEITFRKKLIPLSEPLLLEVQFEKDEYLLSNEELHLLTSSSSLKQGIAEIEDELAALWIEYVEADPGTLTKDAMELRARLKALIQQDGVSVGNA